MKKRLSLCFLIFASLFVTACSPKAPAVVYTPKELPIWYLNPPSNTQQYLYGSGEGKDLKEARGNALENMISQLGISISSSYKSKLQVKRQYREYFTKDIDYTLEAEVKKIRVSNYELIKSQKQSYNQFLVLVRSDKQLFTQGLIKELDMKINSIKSERERYLFSNVIRRQQFYAKALIELDTLLPSLLVLSSLDNSFEDARYLENISKIKKESQELNEKLSFSLVHDKNSKAYKEELQVALTDQGKHVTHAQKNDKDHIFISLHTTTNFSNAQGFDILKATLTIEVKDYQNKVIGGNRIKLSGQATQGKSSALRNSSKKLQKLIVTSSIEKVLGISGEL